jgi:YVTN family beta-propeller protein
VINGATNTVVGSPILVGLVPYGIAYDSANKDLYVTNYGGVSVSVVSTVNNSLISHSPNTIAVGLGPEGIAYDSANGDLYVANFNGDTGTSVSVISGANNSLISHSVNTITVGNGPVDVAYDSSNGYVYVANEGSGTVTVINGATNLVVGSAITIPGGGLLSIAYDSLNGYVYVGTSSSELYLISSVALVGSGLFVGNSPSGIAVDAGNGNVYISNEDVPGTVTVVSGTTDSVIGMLTVTIDPMFLAYDSANGDIYVPDAFTNTVSVISTVLNVNTAVSYLRGTTQGGTVTGGPIGAGSSPRGALYDGDNGDIYVSNGNNANITVISGKTNTVVTNIGVGMDPWNMAYDSANGLIYVADEGSNCVSVISGSSNRVVGVVGVGNIPIGVGYDSSNGDVYVPNYASNNVSVISGATDKVVASIGVGSEPVAVETSTANGFVYVANENSANLSVIYTTTNKVIASIGVGFDPDGIGYDPVNKDLYVANFVSDNVTVISSSTNKVLTNIGVGSEPRSIAFDSANELLYLTNEGNSNVSVISGVTNKVLGSINVGNSPIGISYDAATAGIYVVGSGASNVDMISTFQSASSTSTMTEDVGQSLLISVPLLGLGDGMSQATLTVAGLGCVVDLPDNSQITLACTGGAAGTFSVTVNVQDPSGAAVDSTFSVTVYSDPSVGVPTATPPSVDVGQSVSFVSATPTGGTGSYNYSWSGLPTGCVNSGTATDTCVPTVAMTYPSVVVKIIDSDGYSALSSALAFTVYTDPTVGAPTANVSSIDVGHGMVEFVVTAGGGSGGNFYAWSGLPAGCVTADTTVVSCTPTSSGSFAISVAVMDSNGYAVTSGALPFTVYSDVVETVAPLPTPFFVDVGQQVSFRIPTPTGGFGGTGVYSYLWYNLPNGCFNSGTTIETCTPTSPGVVFVAIQITDSNGYSTSSPTTPFTVDSDPTIGTPIANHTSMDQGWGMVGFSTTSAGGSGGNTFTWNGLPTGCGSINTNTISCTPTGAGAFTVSVTVQDSYGFAVTSGSLLFNVYADPSFSGAPTSSATAVDVGQSVTFTSAAVGGGSGGDNYVWSGLPTGCSSSGAAVDTCTPTGSGSFTSVAVKVTDSNGYTSASAFTLSISVSSDPTVALTESLSSADLGQSVTFTSSASGGASPYSYLWSGLPSGTGCSGTIAIISCTLLTAPTGTFSVAVQVTDANSYVVSSGIVTFTVYTDPSVSGSVFASPLAVDVGQTVTFATAAPSGGSGSYSYMWAGLPTGCSPSGAASDTCIPTGSGTFSSVMLTVIDSNGRSGSSLAGSIIVSSAPTAATPTANVTAADVGWGTVQFTTLIGGGPGGDTFTWNGLPTGCVTADFATDSCTPTVTGTFSVSVTLVDGNDYSVTSQALAFTVYSDPVVGTPAANVTSADLGWKSVGFTSSTPSGGSGVYTYSWSGLPGGCSSTSASFSCTPTSTGTFSITVKVKDSNTYPRPATSSVLSFTVYGDPTMSGSPIPSPTGVDLGQSVVFTSPAPSGGSGGYVYLWSGLPTGCSSSGASTDTCTPTATGTYSVTVRALDSNSYWMTSNPISFTVYSDPTVGAPTANLTSSDVGWKSVMFTSSAPSGGSGGYTYSWTGLPNGCTGTTSSISCTPTGTGSFSITVTVKDSLSYSVTSIILAFTVYSDPAVAGMPGEGLPAIDVGQTVIFTSPPLTGGSGGDTYVWTGLPQGCSSSGASTDICVPTGAGTSASLKVKVIDSNGYTSAWSSAAASFVVSSDPTVALTESASSGDYGQSVTFTSTPSGGAGTFSYVWNGLPTGTGCSGTTATITCSSLSSPAGIFSVSVTVTDANGYSAGSGVMTFTVYTDPSVLGSPAVSVAGMDLGQSVMYTSPAPSGGSGGYTYSWSNLPTGCSSSGVATVICTPVGVGTFPAVRVAVTDSNGVTSAVSSNAGTLTVYLDPTVTTPSPTATSAYIDQSSSVGFSTVASQGTANYASYFWSGLPSGCTGTVTNSVTCAGTVFTTATTYSISVTVTDSAGVTSPASSALAFTVYADPQVSTPVGNMTSADSGQSVLFTTTASFGTGSYTSYSWTGLPASGCLGTTTSSPTCTFTVATATKYTISVEVTDSTGEVSAASSSLVFWAYPDPTVGSAPTPSQSSSDLGQTVTITATASSGTGTYSTYTWSGLPAGKCSGITSATVVCVFTSSATLTVSVTVTDSNGVRSAASSTLSFKVYADPVVTTPTPSVPSFDVGGSGSVTFSTTASLGTTSYASYAWSGLPSGCTGTSTASVNCLASVFATAATYPISTTVTDSNGETSLASGSLTFTVFSAPQASTPVGNVTSVDNGQSATFGTVASFGTGSYSTYAWFGLPTGCTGTTTSTVSCTFSATTATAYSLSVTVKDSNGVTSPYSSTLVFWAYPDPVVTGAPTSSQTSADVGQTVTLTASASGGTGGYTMYTWSGLPGTGCSGATTSVVVCGLAAAGSLSIGLTVTDSNGVTSAPSSVLSLVVYSDPLVSSPVALPSGADLGQTVTFSAAASLGSGDYTYSWTVSQAGLGCASSISNTLTCVPTVVGNDYVVSVVVTDSNHNTSVRAFSAAFNVSGDPGVTTPTATATSLDAGQSITLSTIPTLTTSRTQGSGSVSYYWAGLPAGCQSSNASSIECTPASAGVYSVTVSITDSNGMNVTSHPLALVVSGKLQSVSVTASAGTMDSGQLLVVDASATGGSGSYTYSWSHLPTGCTSANSPTLECSPVVSATSEFTVYVNVTDSNSAVETGTVSVTVQPALTMTLAANRTSALIDTGSVVFTATVAGGSSPYTYTWYLNGTAVTNTADQFVMGTSHAGTYLVTVSVKDAVGVTVSAGAAILTVSSPPATTQTTSSSTNSVTGVDWMLLVLLVVMLVLLVLLIAVVAGGRKKSPSPGGNQGRQQGPGPDSSPPMGPAEPVPATASVTIPSPQAPSESAPAKPDWEE